MFRGGKSSFLNRVCWRSVVRMHRPDVGIAGETVERAVDQALQVGVFQVIAHVGAFTWIERCGLDRGAKLCFQHLVVSLIVADASRCIEHRGREQRAMEAVQHVPVAETGQCTVNATGSTCGTCS